MAFWAIPFHRSDCFGVLGMDAATRFDTEIVGALPVISNYLERLQLADLVDELVPWEGEVPLGTIVEVLVSNRLLNPKALFRIDDWTQQTGLSQYYGLEAGQLNDDRLGRALERLAAHAEQIQAGLVLRAVKKFKLDVSQIHYDITSVELFGAYDRDLQEGQNPAAPRPTYGHSKSGRKNLKQVQLGLNVTGDGGVPVGHVALDGNTAEATTHLDNLRRLRALLPKKWELYIADTKLDTPENLLAIGAARGKFVCGGALTTALQQLFLRHRKQLRPVAYCPKSQEHLPPEQRDQYQGFELPDRLVGIHAGRQTKLDYRQVFVWSQAKERQEASTRERHVAKIQKEFEAVERNLNKYSLKTQEAVRRRLEAARAKYAEGQLFTYELKERSGTLRLQWQIDAEALKEWKLLEGVFVLKTNLKKKQCPLPQVLRKYKEQIQVERRMHHLKGPLAVPPLFLEKPERIAGLLCILVWALMVLALLERQVRRNLKGKPLYGVYPENRPSPAPTGPSLLECFSMLCIVIIKHRGKVSRRLADPSDIQRRLLLLLGIPPGDLKTFKRRCGM
jgi:transposase